MISRGVLYYAVGEKYVREAIRSAESLRQWMPNIAIGIATGSLLESVPGANVFDEVVRIGDDGFSFHDVKGLHRTPFEQTIFLDTDTYVCRDIGDLFELLNHFDLAVAHDSVRFSPQLDSPYLAYVLPEVPAAFPEMNTGVVAFRNSEQVQAFFASWKQLYAEQCNGPIRPYHDQPAFTEALYRSKLRFTTLPHEYNCRFNSAGYLAYPARVLHGRHPDMPSVAEKLNAYSGPRIFWYNRGGLFVYPSRGGLRSTLSLMRPDRMFALLRRAVWR